MKEFIESKWSYFWTLYPNSGEVLLELVKSIVCVAVVIAAISAVSRRSAAARVWLLRAGFLALAAAAIGSVIPRSNHWLGEAVSYQKMPEPVEAGAIGAAAVVVSKENLAQISQGGDAETAAIKRASFDLTEIFRWMEANIKAVWFSGFGLGVSWLMLRYWVGSIWLRRNSQAAPDSIDQLASRIGNELELGRLPRCRIVDRLSSPMMTGWSRANLWLSPSVSAMSEREIRAIISHELAHHCRRDLPWQAFASLVAAFWWWNPAVWKLLGRLKSEVEFAADENVVSQQTSAVDYAEILLRVASEASRDSVRSVGLRMAGRSSIECRIRAVLEENPFRNRVGWISGCTVGMIAVGGMLTATISVVAQDRIVSGNLNDTKHAADRAALLDGVREIQTHDKGVPGGLTVFGPDAFALVGGRAENSNALLPVTAASAYGKGKLVVFGHDGFLIAIDQKDTGRMLLNSARWAAAGKAKIKVGVFGMYDNWVLLNFLRSNGFEAVLFDSAGWPTNLAGIDVVFVNALKLTANDVAPLDRYLREGGGLVTGVTGWGWSQLFADNDADRLAGECPGNLLIKRAGIVFNMGTPRATLPGSYAVGGDMALLNASNAHEAISAIAEGKIKLTPAETSQSYLTRSIAVHSLPADDAILRAKLLPKR
jgi:beta-lactamase regulating signal transducer with metallopeptidase domain